MHIEEPATEQLGAQFSRRCAQAFTDQEQLQQVQDSLEICQRSPTILQTALAANNLGLWDWNLMSDRIYYDPQCKRILGYEVEEVTNNYQFFEQLVHPVWGLLIVHNCSNYRQWDEWEIETLKQLSVELAIAIDQSELFQQVQKENSDRQFVEAKAKEKSQQLEITLAQIQTVQGQLLQNDKMANLGHLVTEIANEIHNPVNFIYSTLHSASQYAEDLIRMIELYQHYHPTPTPVIASHLQRLKIDFVKTDFLKMLWSMRAGTDRIREIVSALRHFSRFNDGQMRKVDLHQGFNSVLRILQHRLKETAR